MNLFFFIIIMFINDEYIELTHDLTAEEILKDFNICAKLIFGDEYVTGNLQKYGIINNDELTVKLDQVEIKLSWDEIILLPDSNCKYPLWFIMSRINKKLYKSKDIKNAIQIQYDNLSIDEKVQVDQYYDQYIDLDNDIEHIRECDDSVYMSDGEYEEKYGHYYDYYRGDEDIDTIVPEFNLDESIEWSDPKITQDDTGTALFIWTYGDDYKLEVRHTMSDSGYIMIKTPDYDLVVGCEGCHPYVYSTYIGFDNSDGSTSFRHSLDSYFDPRDPNSIIDIAVNTARDYIEHSIH